MIALLISSRLSPEQFVGEMSLRGERNEKAEKAVVRYEYSDQIK